MGKTYGENGRYVVLDQVGEGGMGFVYRVKDTRLGGRLNAVKVLRPNLADKPKPRARFLREMHAMAMTSHPNLVVVHDAGEENGEAWVAMEFVEGRDLEAVANAYGPIPPRAAVDIVAAVARALGAVHRRGIVHRDVKPHNVMMCLDGTPKLMDFGVAHIEDSNMTKSMDVMGTQGYMAPEQIMQASRVDARADLFALLVMLTRLVTGSKPNFYEKALTVRALSQLPEPLRKVVEGGTRFQREDRVYNNASQLVRDLLTARNQLEEDGSDAFFASLAGEVVDVSVPEVREISEEPLAPPLSSDPLSVPEARLRPTPQPAPAVAAVVSTPVVPGPDEAAVATVAAKPEAPVASVTRGFTAFFEGAKAEPVSDVDDEVPSNSPVRPNWGRRLRVPLGLLALLGVVGGVVAVGWNDTVPSDVAPTLVPSPVPVQPEAPVVADPVVTSAPTVELPEPPAPVTSLPAARPATTVKPVTVQAPTPVPSPAPTPEEPKLVESTPAPVPMGTVVVQGKDVSVDFLSAAGKSYSPGSVPPGSYTVRATFNDDSVYTSDFRVNVADGQTVTVVCSAKFKNCRAP